MSNCYRPLTVIDHSKLDDNKIFVTTDASDRVTGAVLSFGPSWETARPVTFDSRTLKGAELNYPVHEKELLAVLHALRKWKVDLIGSPFFVYTDHKTLLNFHTQRDLSCHQARWMEELAIYDCRFIYVKGELNTVADSLSRFPFHKLLTHAYGMESQLASQGEGLRPKVNIGSNCKGNWKLDLAKLAGGPKINIL